MKYGLIGSGMLGGALAKAAHASGLDLMVANRSGQSPVEGLPVTTDPQAVVEACDAVVLCVPPASAGEIAMRARDTLVVSVMAGIPRDQICALTGSPRVVRAMSSPAAGLGLAYSPWCASASVTAADRAMISAFFGACGETDEVPDEAQIELFTAMTGPVPGFVAQFAASMVTYATERGVDPDVADRAVRQLFHASGVMMSTGPSPADHVQEMVEYAGTTAAGLLALQATTLDEDIATGLDAAVQKTRALGG
ncbi:pyrroline-5-carboxylate reductase dimerization domain-containing protein [Maritimibacter sp. UBA3975]|uniref:pyrroline-5-carboxylate reductase family protein n=1 Tax=Maritimibacter sp. UBA3975 TaxID=1946833 RepID=UPI000C0B052C|nr:pyrroline-5-carboxylate reductase dimerization domain-containing protein [Maritimibacter sp. UBA3975]MAM63307.1 pyrroline-5-carboxylate reductase [Maritimibacter sp.]|tara:strand:+ start:38291 stop:39046 length:756 start_codon:yes stop_codon:yes gene_type:complete